MNEKERTILFGGHPLPDGGLDNEEEVARECPEEFKSENEWSRYAIYLYTHQVSESGDWKWRSDDLVIRGYQRLCLIAVLETFDVRHEDNEAIAGWMLSVMLTEVPDYNPDKK